MQGAQCLCSLGFLVEFCWDILIIFKIISFLFLYQKFSYGITFCGGRLCYIVNVFHFRRWADHLSLGSLESRALRKGFVAWGWLLERRIQGSWNEKQEEEQVGLCYRGCCPSIPLGHSQWLYSMYFRAAWEGDEKGSIYPSASIPHWPGVALQAFTLPLFWVRQALGVPHMIASGCMFTQDRRTEVCGESQ